MSNKPVLHPRTAEQVDQFTGAPSHAVMLVGANGIGKTHLATIIAAAVLGLEPAALGNYPYFLTIQPDGTSISIESVRALQKFLQLKTLGTGEGVRRIVLVEHAEVLTIEAQNAFLKILEEPPADTLILLTADNRRALLPTILSRVQLITVHAPVEADVKAYFADYGDATALSQAFFLSGGLPGLMSALLNKDQAHPLTEGVTQAKAILQKQTFERLAMVEGLSKQKEAARYVLEALLHIAQTGISGATAKRDVARLKQWHHIMKVTSQAQDALLQNANPKLTLTNLMLNL
jgi:DNA polymerase-3 subunit delta'